MRTFKFNLFAINLLLLIGTAPVAANSITVVIENIEQNQGKIMLQLLSGEAEFEGQTEATGNFTLRARTERMRFSTSNLPAGDYAIRVIHDVNDNDELDTNYIGLPTEPYAFSNNAKGNFGPPHWQDVKFVLSGSVVQNLLLLH